MLFLSEEDYARHRKGVLAALTAGIPAAFMGYSTSLDCTAKNTIDVFTVRGFLKRHLAADPSNDLTVFDWLRFPSQKLLELTSGKIFHDDLNLAEVIGAFTYYPHDVWLYMLSCQWVKVSQEEAFLGRCGDVGDELGSQIVGARMVRELVKLCFLMERKYAPYSKWFGTAFAGLASARELSPILRNVLLAESWREREGHLSQAYARVAALHNLLGITEPLQADVSQFHDRPYDVIHGMRFAEAIRGTIQDDAVRAIKSNAGAIDQFIDSTDVLGYPQTFKKLNIWNADWTIPRR